MVSMTQLAALPGRAVIAIEGDDRVAFLQGLVSNDVTHAKEGRAVWAAFLTPQGKYLADFFIIADQERLLLDGEAAQMAMLLPRLARYRLRSKVTMQAAPEQRVYVAWGGAEPTIAAAHAVIAADPRLPEAGWRVITTAPVATNADAVDWDRYRLTWGLPDGAQDLEPEKSVLLEAGFDELHGVSWTKGCYLGQELTARTKYRGLVKRRLVPVSVAGPLPAPGTPVLRDGVEVGTMRSGHGEIGLALLRVGALTGPLACGQATLMPRVPTWIRVPEAAS